MKAFVIACIACLAVLWLAAHRGEGIRILLVATAKVSVLHGVVESAAEVVQWLRPLLQATLALGGAARLEGTKHCFLTGAATQLVQLCCSEKELLGHHISLHATLAASAYLHLI